MTMTHSIDLFLIDHGFDDDELLSLNHRSHLHYTIAGMSMLALTFTTLVLKV